MRPSAILAMVWKQSEDPGWGTPTLNQHEFWRFARGHPNLWAGLLSWGDPCAHEDYWAEEEVTRRKEGGRSTVPILQFPEDCSMSKVTRKHRQRYSASAYKNLTTHRDQIESPIKAITITSPHVIFISHHLLQVAYLLAFKNVFTDSQLH